MAFKMTKYGSKMFARRWEDHKTVAMITPNKVPRIKPKTVSNKVTCKWRNIEPSKNFSTSKSTIFVGELKISGSIQCMRLAYSHNENVLIKMINCQNKMIRFSYLKR